jgi:hypothetical protein
MSIWKFELGTYSTSSGVALVTLDRLSKHFDNYWTQSDVLLNVVGT